MTEYELLKCSPAELTDMGICPTCFNREHNGAIYGDDSDIVIYKDNDIDCFFFVADGPYSLMLNGGTLPECLTTVNFGSKPHLYLSVLEKQTDAIEADNTDIYSGKLDRNGYISVAKKLTDRFGFKGVAITLRESISANDNNWSGMLYTDGEAYFSKKYSIHIVDRVGGGDSFGGGLIYSLINNYEPQKAIEFAIAASCLKHSIEGDYNFVSKKEVETLAGGDASGRVQR